MEIGLSYFRGDIEAGAEDEVFFKIESGHFTDKAPHKNFELSIRCLDEETGQAMVNAAQEFFRLWKKILFLTKPKTTINPRGLLTKFA